MAIASPLNFGLSVKYLKIFFSERFWPKKCWICG